MRILFLLVFFSFPAWSALGPVGSVDSDYGRQSAACSNSPESVSKANTRDINPEFHLANLQGLVQLKGKSPLKHKRHKKGRRGDSGGSKGAR